MPVDFVDFRLVGLDDACDDVKSLNQLIWKSYSQMLKAKKYPLDYEILLQCQKTCDILSNHLSKMMNQIAANKDNDNSQEKMDKVIGGLTKQPPCYCTKCYNYINCERYNVEESMCWDCVTLGNINCSDENLEDLD